MSTFSEWVMRSFLRSDELWLLRYFVNSSERRSGQKFCRSEKIVSDGYHDWNTRKNTSRESVKDSRKQDAPSNLVTQIETCT